jgi:hypothetical protein
VRAFFPWELVSVIGVINNAIADKVKEANRGTGASTGNQGSEKLVLLTL